MAKRNTAGDEVSVDLLTRAALFAFSTHSWGGRAKADMGKIDTLAEKRMLTVRKVLLECDEFKAIRSYQKGIKEWCLARSMPSFIRKGMYVVLLDQIQDYEVKLAEARDHVRNVLVPAFLAVYPATKEAARPLLGDQFREADYPAVEDMAHRFGIEWQWVYFGVPDNLPEGVRRREAEKLRKAYEDAQQQIVGALRASFAELVTHATERLTVEPGKPAPVLRESVLERFTEFFETFSARNLMLDDDLMASVEEARGLLQDVNAEAIRDDEGLRTRLAENFAKIKANVSTLVEQAPVRKFTLEEE